jgi:hypothetical protein
MSFWNKPQTWLIVGVAFLGLLLVQQFWHWEVERVEVPSDHFLVRIHLWGEDLGEDEIIAPDENHKGVLEDVYKEGRYFLNPLVWDHQIHKATIVPPGRFLVLTRKFGQPIPPERVARGEILASPGERGILPEIKGPGKYYINPHAYDISEHEAVQIRAGQVGVRTLLWGKDPRELKRQAGDSVFVVKEGYRGVQEKPLQPETYYPNPYVERIVPIDTRTHEVLFTDIDFPSPDGFHLNPHIKVVYRVMPDKAPLLFVTLSNDGVLHQADASEKEKDENERICPHRGQQVRCARLYHAESRPGRRRRRESAGETPTGADQKSHAALREAGHRHRIAQLWPDGSEEGASGAGAANLAARADAVGPREEPGIDRAVQARSEAASGRSAPETKRGGRAG